MTGGIKAALAREKQINEYRRENKNQLVDRMNPEWIDLYGRLEFER
jgi:predicted GIY-YIG superfamily endonuclease